MGEDVNIGYFWIMEGFGGFVKGFGVVFGILGGVSLFGYVVRGLGIEIVMFF